MIIILIDNTPGEFFWREQDKSFDDDFSYEPRLNTFKTFKEDFKKYVHDVFDGTEVFTDENESIILKLPYFGKVELHWLPWASDGKLGGLIMQYTDINQEIECDKKMKLVLKSLIEKHPDRYQIDTIPRG